LATALENCSRWRLRKFYLETIEVVDPLLSMPFRVLGKGIGGLFRPELTFQLGTNGADYNGSNPGWEGLMQKYFFEQPIRNFLVQMCESQAGHRVSIRMEVVTVVLHKLGKKMRPYNGWNATCAH
jgi:hypothetical protein